MVVVLLVGMYSPPYGHDLFRRAVGVVSGTLIALLGLAQARNWFGLGSALFADPEAAGSAAAMAVFVGFISATAWLTGLVG